MKTFKFHDEIADDLEYEAIEHGVNNGDKIDELEKAYQLASSYAEIIDDFYKGVYDEGEAVEAFKRDYEWIYWGDRVDKFSEGSEQDE